MHTGTLRAALLASASCLAVAGASSAVLAQDYFERVSTYPVFLNLPEGTDPTTETVAEIVAVTGDGMTLVYTDGENEALGMVDITDPQAPEGLGEVTLEGEPTSVAIAHGMALAGVNTSESFTEPDGHVAVVDIEAREVMQTCDLGGQPDSVAVSPDGSFLAVAIENERDEDLNDGVIPQLPPGALAILDLGEDGVPTNCESVRMVDLTGLAEVAGSDPEPEYVDINEDNVAVVTLQENNHLVLVDMVEGAVTGHFSAGTVDLESIDTEDDGIVQGTGSLADVPREPDAVAWINTTTFVTANEGDYEGGSRGITVFNTDGEVLYDSGSDYEHLGMAIGHYPDGRADNKGMEPEGVTAASFGDDALIFVLSERGNTVAIYRDTDNGLELHQVLPTAVAPEGVVTVPERQLLAVATEEDDEEEGIRATLSLYTRTAGQPPYPDLRSTTEEATGAPIGWGALSGMVADDEDADTLHAVSDSAYAESRIYTIDLSSEPAEITGYVTLTRDGAPAAHDLEGIALRDGGGFWVVSEGDPDDDTLNLLMAVAEDGAIEQTIDLPEDVSATRTGNGFEGVTAWVGEDGGERVAVVVQRSWQQDPEHHTLLGFYDVAEDAWRFAYTPIAEPTSERGGWVGQSELTYLGDDRFLLIERDNQPGVYSTHKVLTVVSTEGVDPAPWGEDVPVIEERQVVFDLLPVLRANAGWIGDKPEGLAITADGMVWLVTDNDGVDDAHGQTQLLELGPVDQVTRP